MYLPPKVVPKLIGGIMINKYNKLLKFIIIIPLFYISIFLVIPEINPFRYVLNNINEVFFDDKLKGEIEYETPYYFYNEQHVTGEDINNEASIVEFYRNAYLESTRTKYRGFSIKQTTELAGGDKYELVISYTNWKNYKVDINVMSDEMTLKYIINGKEQTPEFYQVNINQMWNKIRNNIFNKLLRTKSFNVNLMGIMLYNNVVEVNDQEKYYRRYGVVNNKTLVGGLWKRVE